MGINIYVLYILEVSRIVSRKYGYLEWHSIGSCSDADCSVLIYGISSHTKQAMLDHSLRMENEGLGLDIDKVNQRNLMLIKTVP